MPIPFFEQLWSRLRRRTVEPPPSGWIRGAVEGEYVADAEQGRVTLIRAWVRGAVQVDGPPPDDPRELRESEPVPGWILIGEEVHAARLHDLRLRDWADHPSATRFAGRLEGTGWARLAGPAPALDGAGEPVEPAARPTMAGRAVSGALGCLAFAATTTFLVGAFAAVWIGTTPTLAGVWCAGAVVPFILGGALRRNTRGWSRAGSAAAGALVSAAALGLALLALRQAGEAPCDPRSWEIVAAIAGCVYLAAFLPPAWPAHVARIAWTVGILAWGARSDETCLAGADAADPRAAPELRALQRTTSELRARAAERGASDPGAALIEAAGQRMSVDAALADPAAACARPVVITGAMLFPPDSDALSADAEPSLRKLRRALAEHPFATVTVTGHVPQTASWEQDADRSQIQAQNVVEWLQANSTVPLDGLKAEPGGSRSPLVDGPELAALNHRIEVTIDCR